MDVNTIRDLVRTIRQDRAETVARLAKVDAVLANLRDLYPDMFSDAPPTNPDSDTESTAAPEKPTGGIPGVFPARDTKGIVEYIFTDAAASEDVWFTPKEVAELALEYGWKPPEDSPDPIAVIRTRVARMEGLDSRQRDGRTKEYRLKTPGAATAATVTTPGPASTQRAGGDDHAAPPATSEDHDPTPGGRNDRDLYRLADDRVAVQF